MNISPEILGIAKKLPCVESICLCIENVPYLIEILDALKNIRALVISSGGYFLDLAHYVLALEKREENLEILKQKFTKIEKLTIKNISIMDDNNQPMTPKVFFNWIKSFQNLKKIDLNVLKVSDYVGLSTMLSMQEISFKSLNFDNKSDLEFFKLIAEKMPNLVRIKVNVLQCTLNYTVIENFLKSFKHVRKILRLTNANIVTSGRESQNVKKEKCSLYKFIEIVDTEIPKDVEVKIEMVESNFYLHKLSGEFSQLKKNRDSTKKYDFLHPAHFD